MNTTDVEAKPRRRFRKRWLVWAFVLVWIGVGAWHTLKPMPPGTNIASAPVKVAATDVQFLYDLTRGGANDQIVYEQHIFDEVFRIVDEAESYVIADFFLVNDLMGAAKATHRPLSRELADHLIARKKANPSLAVLLIADPINEVYGGEVSELFKRLRDAGVEVVVTDLESMRDSNPAYSALWRMFGQWWGNAPGKGAMPNPFDTEPATVTLRSWLALANFKANHRKLIVADRADDTMVGLITSANPHDASSGHSNVALRFTGELARTAADSEMAIARNSGWAGHILISTPQAPAPEESDAVELSLITEGAIREHLVRNLDATRDGDAIRIATFYLADRVVIDALLRAADRGVKVQLILDPNRDAFGREKDGVPNRPVANELVTKSGDRIEIRWYRTHGEQFHTKLALIERSDTFVASLGSANLTRRNIGSYNLEANVALSTTPTSALAKEMNAYFERLWTNGDGPTAEFTAPFGAWKDEDSAKYWRYRVMEGTGLSTF